MGDDAGKFFMGDRKVANGLLLLTLCFPADLLDLVNHTKCYSKKGTTPRKLHKDCATR